MLSGAWDATRAIFVTGCASKVETLCSHHAGCSCFKLILFFVDNLSFDC